MKKKQIDEKQLLTDATYWFEKKHGVLPDDANMEFSEIWHKPTIFGNTHCVVFAPTAEIGNAFIREQNIILHSMKLFPLLPFFFVATLGALFSLSDNLATLTTVGGIIIGLLFCTGLFYYYLARRCKQYEQIHNWNIEVYHSGL